jgi:hypothetical protein
MGISPSGKLVFLPFRDSNEDITTHSSLGSITKVIFSKDIACLDAAAALVAPFGDIQFDSGMCFEIGYAYARGIPIIGIVTNFVGFRSRPTRPPVGIDGLIGHALTAEIIGNKTPRDIGGRGDYGQAEDVMS